MLLRILPSIVGAGGWVFSQLQPHLTLALHVQKLYWYDECLPCEVVPYKGMILQGEKVLSFDYLMLLLNDHEITTIQLSL